MESKLVSFDSFALDFLLSAFARLFTHYGECRLKECPTCRIFHDTADIWREAHGNMSKEEFFNMLDSWIKPLIVKRGPSNVN